MNEVARLIKKHRANGLLLDTNLLVVLLVGRTNRKRIPDCRRTQTYSIRGYELLESLVGQFSKVVTTPHLLTEVSNLDPLRGKERATYQLLYRRWIDAAEENYEESRALSGKPLFDRFGLSDTAIESVAWRGMLVLTDDLDLYHILCQRGVDAINFNHIRTVVW
jgi:hypothetical protein